MENSLVKSVIEICRTLNEQSVEYLIVGGTAVGFYGYYRGSTASDGSPLGKHDLDFWYNPILENYYKLLVAFVQSKVFSGMNLMSTKQIFFQ